MGAFGDKLRQHRERHGLSLDAISAATKIGTRMLSAIEDERFDQLPGGVFNKGFVRAYARHVGLNEDEAISAYLAAERDSQLHSHTTPNFRASSILTPKVVPPARSDNRPSGDRPNDDRRTHQDRRLQPRRSADRTEIEEDRVEPENNHVETHRSDFSNRNDGPEEDHFKDDGPGEDHPRENNPADYETAAPAETPSAEYEEPVPTQPLSFLNLSAPSESSYDDPQTEPPAHQSDFPNRVPWQNLAIPLILITLAIALWGLHRRSSAASTKPAPPPISTPAPTIASTAASSAPTPQTAAAPAPPHEHPAPVSLHSEPAPPVVHPRPPVAKPNPMPTFTLVIRAAQTSWVSIIADGQPIAHETLIAPAHTSVKAAHEIVVKTGNAAALSFQINHKEIPSQGSPGEVRTYTFDSSGLRDSSPSSTANAR